MSGGGSRVLIPNNVRKTIHDIKEITGKHSDDDIYAMLKECNMDPNETAQRLLYLDTFHEVKRKQDRRKVNVSNKTSEEYRATQWRGARSGRGIYSSSYSSDDTGGQKNVSARKENGVNNRAERGSRSSSVTAVDKTENSGRPSSTSSTDYADGPLSVSNGSSSHGPVPKLSMSNSTGILKDTAVDVSKLAAVPALSIVAVKEPSASPLGLTPTPTTAYAPGDNFLISTTSASASGVYASASDPVLAPSLNSWTHGAVCTIERDVGSQRIVPESHSTLLPGGRHPATSGAVSATNSGMPENRQGIQKNRSVESLPVQDSSPMIISGQDDRPPQQMDGSSRVNDSVFEEATVKLDMKLGKLDISAHQPVVFPDHLQVPEAIKNGLTFGSLDTSFGGKGSAPLTESVQGKNVTTRESLMSNPSTAQESKFSDHPQALPHVPENILPLEDNVSAGALLKYDQSKPEIMPPLGGPHYPLLQTAPDYSFAYMPPVVGPHLMQIEGPDLQNGNSLVPSTSGSTTPASQPAATGQNSIAVSPQMFPVMRHPYMPNYFTYPPYFPQLYLPQSAHQFIGHTGFPHQPSTGNIYIPSAAVPSGTKFPVPPLYKPGTNTGNLTHYGIPPGYGSYTSTPGGYDSTATLNSGSSASNQDLAASEMKEKNMYSTLQQGKESQFWPPAPVPGRDVSNLQTNYFYNLPHGQHVAFSPAQASHNVMAAIYHPTQTAAPAAQPLMQQSQAMAGSVDSVVPPSGAYQHTQHSQINWNPKLLNRENI